MKLRKLPHLTKEEAVNKLIAAATELVKEARYYPYGSKLNGLRIPLIQLKKAIK